MVSRKWHMSRALESYRVLGTVINELTLVEITDCLDLEAGSQRRRSVIDRLITRAIQLSVLEITNRLQEKYLGKITIEDHDHRREKNCDYEFEDGIERT